MFRTSLLGSFVFELPRLTNIVYPVSSNITLHYDVLNWLTNMVDGVDSTVYGYDAVGQLLSRNYAVGREVVATQIFAQGEE